MLQEVRTLDLQLAASVGVYTRTCARVLQQIHANPHQILCHLKCHTFPLPQLEQSWLVVQTRKAASPPPLPRCSAAAPAPQFTARCVDSDALRPHREDDAHCCIFCSLVIKNAAGIQGTIKFAAKCNCRQMRDIVLIACTILALWCGASHAFQGKFAGFSDPYALRRMAGASRMFVRVFGSDTQRSHCTQGGVRICARVCLLRFPLSHQCQPSLLHMSGTRLLHTRLPFRWALTTLNQM